MVVIIKDNPDIPWVWHEISWNLNINWDIIKDNPDKPWNWYEISRILVLLWNI